MWYFENENVHRQGKKFKLQNSGVRERERERAKRYI